MVASDDEGPHAAAVVESRLVALHVRLSKPLEEAPSVDNGEGDLGVRLGGHLLAQHSGTPGDLPGSPQQFPLFVCQRSY